MSQFYVGDTVTSTLLKIIGEVVGVGHRGIRIHGYSGWFKPENFKIVPLNNTGE